MILQYHYLLILFLLLLFLEKTNTDVLSFLTIYLNYDLIIAYLLISLV